MKFTHKLCACFFILMNGCGQINAQSKPGISQWLTNSDRSQLFRLQQNSIPFSTKASTQAVIEINEAETFQSIDGFGFALTGGSAQHIIHMSPAARTALLKELFGTDNSTVTKQPSGTGANQIGISYLRLSIGASDLNDHVFSYDDLPAGQTDTAMLQFDLGPDKENVVPVMKEIVKINPAIKILGSPWSPPAWMKNNNDARGGRLKPEYYHAYASYFVKYIKAMKAEGIVIDAITVQNEPLHPGNNPSLLLTAPDEADFIKNHLGPAFANAGIRTKIILYDHNADRPDYPIFILDDPEAKKYVDGSGFHLYGGKITALTDVHNAHPDRNIYFTEQMVVDFGRRGVVDSTRINIAPPVSRLIVGATRNWSRNVIEWNLAADPQYKPFTDRGGCNMCQGAVTIDKDSVSRNLAYYSIAHASKFVRPGSIRIQSNETDSLSNVAFKTPAGKIVLIVANTGKETQTFDIRYKNKFATISLNRGSVATYLWD
ncbi:MAG TPA: glycoside hydrolase family 30 beta sandwich domain-containing protein [Chitinophagaceae bacterium]|nr:glycoside hydrolase family 30 beta sandwich domain-containing protein [Chitinophagaceae bacterium]